MGDDSESGDRELLFLRAVLEAARVSRAFLAWMEAASERLAPERGDGLAAETREKHLPAILAARAGLSAAPPPADFESYARAFEDAFAHVDQACRDFCASAEAPSFARIPQILAALHEVARAEEGFYALRRAVPAFAGYWQLAGVASEDRPARPTSDEGPGTGVLHVSRGGHHGGFSLYVPETYAPERDWPLIVALHGGSGNGRDFLWTWVREAKSLGYLLVAPSASDSTWGPRDDEGLLEILAWTAARYRIDRRRILLTGLSDGATFTLIYGLAHPEIYRALAPLCGVLHPANEPLGNLARTRGVPIYLVHGALDFLFPVETARRARGVLEGAGARLHYRELPELSHTYPRSENLRILDWFAALDG